MVYKKYIELEKAHLYLIEEGFTMLQFKDQVDFELEDAIEVDDKTIEFVEGKSFVTLVDARNIRSNMSHEAREFFATDKKIVAIRKAQAIVVNNLPSRLIAKFYMTFHKPTNPIKIFSDYLQAEDWIRERKMELNQ
ncbi:MAG: hypothetical protein COX70_08215 [Flavobacteriales bacterium CG_4_10_14_0_2_um_filter_32_8]|nr:MAG: hypothetical protein COX70_08215 [Flavobacteriales bacterium CG_4_10_14_0_2_um_filter_32_8]PJB14797.1 MAG: hypothetical protein CO118_06750 [Flavobacteriales bacterium CG_4_9_14_3_um_filter_32_8]